MSLWQLSLSVYVLTLSLIVRLPLILPHAFISDLVPSPPSKLLISLSFIVVHTFIYFLSYLESESHSDANKWVLIWLTLSDNTSRIIGVNKFWCRLYNELLWGVRVVRMDCLFEYCLQIIVTQREYRSCNMK